VKYVYIGLVQLLKHYSDIRKVGTKLLKKLASEPNSLPGIPVVIEQLPFPRFGVLTLGDADDELVSVNIKPG